MKLTVKLYAEAREIVGTAEMELKIEGLANCGPEKFLESFASILEPDVVNKLMDKKKRGLSLKDGYQLMVNDEIIKISEQDDDVDAEFRRDNGDDRDYSGEKSEMIAINDGDVVGILPPFSGG
ncbi:MAG: MoaD/ThiS family protein [Promethearchaeota archaeon]